MSDELIPCQEAVRQLWDYVDGSIGSEDHDRLDQHLAFCQRCCGELEFVKHLRELLAAQAIDPRSAAIERLERYVEGLDR